MQIHQDLVFDHAIAHTDAKDILSTAKSEFVTIQSIQVDLGQDPSRKEDGEPKAPSTPTPNPQMFQNLIREG